MQAQHQTRICFVRHGETDWNVEKRMRGHTDIPLNAHGIMQADRLAKALLKTGCHTTTMGANRVSCAT
jgi:probable phosphoglycerate mutase